MIFLLDENIEMIFDTCPSLAGVADKDGRYPLHYLALRGLRSKHIACLLHSFPFTSTSSKKQEKIFVVRNDEYWNRGDEDGGSGCKGCIEDEKAEGFVKVRWLVTGTSSFYKFGCDGVSEVVKYTDEISNHWFCNSCSNWNSVETFNCEICYVRKIEADERKEGSMGSERKKFRSKTYTAEMLRTLKSNDRRDSFHTFSEKISSKRRSSPGLTLDTSFSSSDNVSDMSYLSTPSKDTADHILIGSPGSTVSRWASSDTESELFRSKSDDYGDAVVYFEESNIKIIQKVCEEFPEACQRTDRGGRLPLHYACRNNLPVDLIQMILERCRV